jgi:hypothetical protein
MVAGALAAAAAFTFLLGVVQPLVFLRLRIDWSP